MQFPIYINLISKTENLVYTRCGILEIFKKNQPGERNARGFVVFDS